jgi:hypothetical protein
MTKAQQLGITEFPYHEFDERGNRVYYERSDGYWEKYEYDGSGNEIYFENSNGYWIKIEYDEHGNEVYCEASNDGKIRRIASMIYRVVTSIMKTTMEKFGGKNND